VITVLHHLVPDCTFQQLAWLLRSHELMGPAELSWTQTDGHEAWTSSRLILEIPCTSPGLPSLDGPGLEGTCSTALPLRPAAAPPAVGSTQGTGVVMALHSDSDDPQWTPGS